MQALKLSLGALLLLAGTAVAADATLDTARRCTQVKDSLERLVCFDRAFASALGDESVKRKERERSGAEAPTTLTAKVAALKQTRQGVFRVTLDNGQVWQQMEMESLFTVAVGDTVQVSKGRMGGYQMAKVSNGRTGGWARVTRTQ